MKRVVWKNKSNNQLCVTIPSASDIKEGDVVELNKSKIKKIAYSGVVGDLFHYGHLHSLQFAKSISDYSICGVFTDEVVEGYRAKPIANLKERKAIFSNLKCVDRVMVQKSRDPTEDLKKIHEEFPDAEIILVHGSDWGYVPGSEYTKKIGGRVLQHPYYERLSNFKIINKIIDNKDKFKDIAHFASLIEGKEKIDSEMANKVIVSNKADTLKALRPLLKKSKIENIFAFTVSDWKNKKQWVLDNIKREFASGKIVIRSSAVNEDTLEKSMAGCFKSVIGVDSGNAQKAGNAVKQVIDSYKHKASESSFNQILAQPQTKDIVMSGVVFTRTLETNSPYYVINYDDSTTATDRVTKGIESKTVKISRFASAEKIPRNLQGVLASVKEIETKIQNIGLDIEFAVNKKKETIIFQVRPLTTSLQLDGADKDVDNSINSLKSRLKELAKRKKHLGGERTIFADMPDWNPAEIIGDMPNYLDYSLYDYIITDSAWHEARTSQMYYNVNPAKLVVLFGNKPYVDVRNTFNSFVPASVSQQLREKLASFCMDKLAKNPELQDKVEFEVVYSCYELRFEERSKELLDAGFTRREIAELRAALINLTNNLVVNSKKTIKEDLNAVKKMEKDRQRIARETKTSPSIQQILRNAKSLLDGCREKGTVQFSRLARLAFIGKIILKSLVNKGIIDHQFYDDFMGSVATVATEISRDFELVCSGKLNKEDFLKKYYHLRPGSYDITSLRYESNPDLLRAIEINVESAASAKFKLNKHTEEKISRALRKEGLRFNAKELIEFAKCALEAREYSKFEFTKNLSDAIELIAMAGEEMGFTRSELAMLSVAELFSTGADRGSITKTWKGIIKSRMEQRELNKKVVLPPIIISENDFDVIQYYTPRPNYITHKKVRAALAKLSREEGADIRGKIVMIENGDPGYDWIFTRNIAGLITKYGGVASHMSIRCAEFGIPAAIGCGVLYDQLVNDDGVVLDCAAKKIIPMRGELAC